MKLPELKNRLKSKYVVRIAAGVLTVALLGTGMSYTATAAKNGANKANTTNVQTEETENKDSLASLLKDVEVEQREIGKAETVYFLASANGEVTKTIVSDHLINKDGAATLKDKTNLTDIVNVKGDEEFTKKGDEIEWNANGSDIYYQGTTTKEAPVSQKVTYYLDGKEIAPADLAGKSGHVEMKFSFTNNTKFTEKVNGEEVSVVVPFATLTAVSLNNDFTNVEVSNGRIENMANGTVVVGYTLPGVIDSLEAEEGFFSEDLDVPEDFTISADVENFEMTTAMTAVVNAGSLTDVNSDIDVSKFDDMIAKLGDGSAQLQDGSKQLSEGLTTLKDSLVTFATGMSDLNKGIKDYTDGAVKVADGIELLNSNIPALTDGMGQLSTGVDAIYENMAKLVDGGNAAAAGVDTLMTSLDDGVTAAETLKASEKAVGDMFTAMKAQNVAPTKDAYEAAITANITAQVRAAVFAGAGINEATYTQMEGAVAQKATIDAGIAQAQAAGLDEATAKAYVLGQADVINAIYENLDDTQKAQVDMGIAQAQAQHPGMDEATAKAYVLKNSGATEAFYTKLATVEGQKAAVDQALTQNTEATLAEKMPALVNETLIQLYGAYCQTDDATDGASFIAGYVVGTESTLTKIKAGAAALQTGIHTLSDGLTKLNKEAVVPVYNGMQLLNEKLPTLTSGVTALSNGSKELVGNNGKLTDGAKKLLDGTSQVTEGVDKLQSGSVELYDGMVQFNEEGISRIVNAYTGDIKPLSNKLQAMIDASNDYQSFTDRAEGVNGSVKFIYKLESISAK